MIKKEKDIIINYNDNCFDVLRYWAAFSVMFLHYTAYAMNATTNGENVMHLLRAIVSFFPGVVVLFTLSGFLVSGSFERSKNRKQYLIKRVFRLYPELWVCTIVNLIVVIVLVKKLLDKKIILWVITQVFGIANTPSCLSSFATGSINGALWTIFVEIQLYIVLCFVYKFLKDRSIFQWSCILGLLIVLNLGSQYASSVFGGGVAKIIERLFVPYAIWFFIGVFCYQYKDRVIPVLKNIFIPLIIIYVAVWVFRTAIPGYYCDILTSLICPLIILGGGYFLPALRLKQDVSYGMFLYHWIVLNVIVYFDLFNKIPWLLCAIFFFLLTMILAWMSSKFVGNPTGRYLKKLIK